MHAASDDETGLVCVDLAYKRACMHSMLMWDQQCQQQLTRQASSSSYICVCHTPESAAQVRETQKTIRDGRTGMESMTIARGMGEQVRQGSCPCCACAMPTP